MRKLFILLTLAMLLITASRENSLAAREQKVSLQVNAGYSTFAMTEYNKDVKELNQLVGKDIMEELKGGLELSGKVKVNVAPNIYLAAGLGYLTATNPFSGTFTSYDVYLSGDELEVVLVGQDAGYAIPLFTELIVQLPNSPIFLGGGLGYYLIKATSELTMGTCYYDPFLVEWTYDSTTQDTTFDGNGIGFHLFGEANYPLTPSLFFTCKVAYRYTGEIYIEDNLGIKSQLNFNGISFTGGLGVKL